MLMGCHVDSVCVAMLPGCSDGECEMGYQRDQVTAQQLCGQATPGNYNILYTVCEGIT